MPAFGFTSRESHLGSLARSVMWQYSQLTFFKQKCTSRAEIALSQCILSWIQDDLLDSAVMYLQPKADKEHGIVRKRFRVELSALPFVLFWRLLTRTLVGHSFFCRLWSWWSSPASMGPLKKTCWLLICTFPYPPVELPKNHLELGRKDKQNCKNEEGRLLWNKTVKRHFISIMKWIVKYGKWKDVLYLIVFLILLFQISLLILATAL